MKALLILADLDRSPVALKCLVDETKLVNGFLAEVPVN